MQGWRKYAGIFARGLAMGAADVVPGVSGGTIAFITGIYEQFIEALSRMNLTAWRLWRREGFAAVWAYVHGGFLLSLFAGILTAVLTVARAVHWLLAHYPVLVWAFFFGLVLACVWFLRREVPRWNGVTLAAAAFGALLAAVITFLPAASGADHGLLYIFCAAALAICAMMLPGISGAFVLVLLGAYPAVLNALRTWDMAVLLVCAAGAVVGLLSFARVLQWLFAHFRTMTIAGLTGFVAGSLLKIWPWQSAGKPALPDTQVAAALLCMVAGFALVFAMETLATRKRGGV